MFTVHHAGIFILCMFTRGIVWNLESVGEMYATNSLFHETILKALRHFY